MTSNELNLAPSEKKAGSKLALFGLAVTGGLAVGLTVVTASFIRPALRRICLPYVPATEQQISNVLKLCRNDLVDKTLVDLGSGDGRIVFAAAREGYHSTGYELNTWLVLYSKLYSKTKGLSPMTHFEIKDLWKADYKKFDNIVIFGVADMMDELSHKLEKEMHDDAYLIACRFPIERWTPHQVIDEGIDSVWLYKKKNMKNAT